MVNFPASNHFFLNRNYQILLKNDHNAFRKGKATGGLPKIKFGIVPEIADGSGTESIYIIPVPAWNRYNEFMAGLLFTNMKWVPSPFEFSIMPLYDFTGKGDFVSSIAGVFNAEYHHWPYTGPFSEITIGTNGKRFKYNHPDVELGDPEDFYIYSKLDPFVEFNFRKNRPRSTVQHSIFFKNTLLWQDEVNYTPFDSGYTKSYETTQLVFNEAGYQMVNSRNIDPYRINLSVQQGDRFVKLAFEFNYKLSYKKFNKGIDVRLFAGTFLDYSSTERNYNFRMSGWEGTHDYQFDEVYFGRSDDHGLWKKQFLIKDGGFKVPTFLGQSNDWIAALNISVDMPLPIPVSIFADIGSYEGINTVFDDINNKIMYDAGISVKPVKDVLEVYFPFFISDDIKRTNDTNNIKFADQIRFVFNIRNITPRKLRDKAIDSFQ